MIEMQMQRKWVQESSVPCPKENRVIGPSFLEIIVKPKVQVKTRECQQCPLMFVMFYIFMTSKHVFLMCILATQYIVAVRFAIIAFVIVVCRGKVFARNRSCTDCVRPTELTPTTDGDPTPLLTASNIVL